jgi:hypothetical protein
MAKVELRACSKTKPLMWLGFFFGLDHRVSVCQASGTMKTGPAARESPSFSTGWSYRTYEGQNSGHQQHLDLA